MFNCRGQAFVEFILVFAVLLAASAGIFALYKSAWKNRYERTGAVAGSVAAAANVSGLDSSGYSEYVK
jgi:uncharacterized protein (UPF0333 family)